MCKKRSSPWANAANALALLRPDKATPNPESYQQSCQRVIHNPSSEKEKPPCTPSKEKETRQNLIPIPTPACMCAREGDAQKSASASVSESVGLCQFDESASASVSESVGLRQFDESASAPGLYHGPIDAQWIYDPAKDPIVVAMIALRIPKTTIWNGKIYYNDKIMRRLMRQIGGDTPFRDLVYEQWCENDKDNMPDSYAAVFFAKLYKRRKELRGGQS